jgi:hypothetical protein
MSGSGACLFGFRTSPYPSTYRVPATSNPKVLCPSSVVNLSETKPRARSPFQIKQRSKLSDKTAVDGSKTMAKGGTMRSSRTWGVTILLTALLAPAIAWGQTPPCPRGAFNPSGQYRNCICSGPGFVKVRIPESNLVRCQSPPVPCPQEAFNPTGQNETCYCPSGYVRVRIPESNLVRCQAPAPCPQGAFSPTGQNANCYCPSGFVKVASPQSGGLLLCQQPASPATPGSSTRPAVGPAQQIDPAGRPTQQIAPLIRR